MEEPGPTYVFFVTIVLGFAIWSSHRISALAVCPELGTGYKGLNLIADRVSESRGLLASKLSA